MLRVVICSPWRGEEARNLRYLQACLRHSYAHGEAPIASHAIGPLVLRDEVPAERAIGLRASLAWIARADLLAVYVDRGTSEGMVREIEAAVEAGIPVEFRRVPGWGREVA